MGRYYGGDIVGKFWFGVQSSSDAVHFGVAPQGPELQYWNCGTFCESTVPLDAPCPSCKPEEECMARDSNQITFSFLSKDLPVVSDILQQLEQTLQSRYRGWSEVKDLLDKDMSWKEGDNEEWISEEVYDHVFDMDHPNADVVARFLLGTQILRCLTVKGSCTFWCEL